MSIKQLYLRLVMIAAVIGPFYWLVFTDDGQRRTDTVMLALFGKGGELNLALDGLSPAVDEARLRAEFPELDFTCEASRSEFGDRACHVEIGAFNGIPAHYVAFIFATGRLAAMKLAYQHAYHAQVLSVLDTRLGTAERVEGMGGAPAVRHWRAGDGFVAAVDAPQLKENQEAALFWVALNTPATPPTAR